MASGLLPDQVDDFVAATLSVFRKYRWTDISLEYQFYVSSTLIDEKKVIEQGGKDISFRLQVSNTGLARNTGMFAVDVTGVEDVLVSASVPWSKQTVNWSYDIDEDGFQSDRETIIKLLQVREHDARNSMAELNEENLWSAPSSTTDVRPMGIPFWIQKDATTTPAGAFNGGNPSTHSSGCAGVSSTTYTQWRNWTFGYTAVTTDDFVKKVKKAIAYTNFQPPVPHPELGFGKAQYVMYGTYDTQDSLERLAESRNDNLGNDVARYLNAVVVGGIPFKWVPYLTSNDSTAPVYGINWGAFRPFVKRGCNMRRTHQRSKTGQHTVGTVHYDTWMNFVCYNRRTCFAGSTS